jgi:hypothetical protein
MSYSDSLNQFRTEALGKSLHPVHHRDLGIKEGDLYPGKKWSDVAIDGVSLDDTIHWDNEIDYIHYLQESAEGTGGGDIIVGNKKVDPTIRESGSSNSLMKGTGESKNYAGTGKSSEDAAHRKWISKEFRDATAKETNKNKTFYRKRKIPTSKTKNYPVKPIRECQTEKKTEIAEKYDEIIDVFDTKVFEYDDIISDDFASSEDQWRDDGELINSIYPSPAFIEGDKTDEWYITYYDRVGDTYRIRKSEDYYGTPVNYSRVMWCPPTDWIQPHVQWDRIWVALDYDRCGITRSYEFRNGVPGGEIPRIQFHGPSL